MSKVKVGIIGLGMIAEMIHIPGLEKSPDAEIYAICDRREAVLHRIGDRLGIPKERRFTEYADLIACDEVEAVDIATPNFLHYEQCLLAIKHKKHVCLEKPVTMNYQQAAELEKAAQAAGIKTAVCFSYRYMAAVRYAKWIIENGLIGDILNLYFSYLKSSAFIAGRKLEWRFRRELAGAGVLTDLGSHMMDMAVFLGGEVKAITAQTNIAINQRKKEDSDEIAEVTTDDACDAMLKMKNGANATISVSRCAIPNKENIRFEIYGTKGMIGFNIDRKDELEVCSSTIDLETGSRHYVPVPSRFYTEQMDAFVKHVRGVQDQYMPLLEDGARVQKYIDAMIEASEQNKWIFFE